MDEIQKTLAQLGRDIKNLIQSAVELSWWSRGAWSYECILNMSAGERDLCANFINKRLEQQSKNPHPVY
jgi:hypothetical protein